MERIDLYLGKVKWNYGAYQIGVGSYLLAGKPKDYMFRVSIAQKDRMGNLKYPHIYQLQVGKIESYDTEMVGAQRNVKVHLVPIGDWLVEEREVQRIEQHKRPKVDKRQSKKCEYAGCGEMVKRAEWEVHDLLHRDQVALFEGLDV